MWLQALAKIPENKQNDWIIESLSDKYYLHIFGRYFFPHIIETEVEDAHIDLIRELSTPEDSGIIFPRGFAKSTWEKIDTLHDIVYGLEPTILYISVTLTDAGFHFQAMRSELENNQKLHQVYGNLVPVSVGGKSIKWTDSHFETTNGVNVVARGANKGRGVNIKNKRPTKIIVDDAESDEQVKNPVRRQMFHDWLYNVIMPSKDKRRGRLKMIGTVIHVECEVLKFYKAHGGIFRRAIEDGKSIWGSYWSIDDLYRVRDGYTKPDGSFVEGIGTRAFNQEYMNDPTNEDLATINPLWIDEHLFVQIPVNKQLALRKVITIDPQSGEKSKADEYAITLTAWYNGDRHRYVLEQKAGRGSQRQQAIEVIRMWQANPDAFVVGVEKVMTQVAVFQNILDWKIGAIDYKEVNNGDRNIPLKAITPKGKDKLARFEMFEPMIERGELHIRPEMKQLREQILFIGAGTLEHDDRVDSMIMGLELSYGGQSSGNRLTGLTDKDTVAEPSIV